MGTAEVLTALGARGDTAAPATARWPGARRVLPAPATPERPFRSPVPRAEPFSGARRRETPAGPVLPPPRGQDAVGAGRRGRRWLPRVSPAQRRSARPWGLPVTCARARGRNTWPGHVTEPPSGLRIHQCGDPPAPARPASDTGAPSGPLPLPTRGRRRLGPSLPSSRGRPGSGFTWKSPPPRVAPGPRAAGPQVSPVGLRASGPQGPRVASKPAPGALRP